MKVIIGCLNSKYIHASLAPWCLLAGVKAFVKNDYDIKVLESTINGNPHDFAQKIISENPQVVSFSCYIWNITGTLEICKEIKENLNCKIILGGPEVAYRPQDILEKYDFIDFVLSGEGEWNFPLLLDNINDNLNVVDGLTYRENNEIITNPEKEYTDTPPSPYSEDFYNNLKGRIAYIETSRGCPYRCAFCLSGRCSKLRFFDLDQVKEDIINLANSGTQTLKFVDRTFNANSKRANEILTFIKDNYGTKIP
ncbi:MAG: B12-binding domain-containing radical SAM protein, partial [Clostridia bacterium]|nr:B12-binding domain-containing radical SAM protein [Clostridia bacterium]